MSLGGGWNQATWGPVALFKYEGKPLEGLKKGCDPKNSYTLAIANPSKRTTFRDF